MKKVYLSVLSCLIAITGMAQTTVSRTSAVYGGSSPFQDSLWTFKATDYSVVRRLGPTVTGHTITGINGIATDPTTGIHYAILKESGVANRVLATINIQTAVCTEIGNLGDKFATLAFNANGTLFGVTGNGALTPETMFRINKATAATTLFRPLGSGADGEIIAFCPDNNMFYHWSGNGTVVWERMDTTGTDIIQGLTYTGTPGGETFGALYIGGGKFLVSNISSNFKIWDTSGTIGASLSSNPDDIRGLVTESYTTSVTTSDPTTFCAGSSAAFSVTGGTGSYQWYKDGVAISGETNATYSGTTSGVYNCVYADANGIIDSPATGITLTVNPMPDPIGGTFVLCAGDMTTLTDGVSGGTWTSSDLAVATIGSSDGMLMAIAAGTADISYTLTGGCMVTQTITVNALPSPITGSFTVCVGSITSLGDAATGGTWSSSTPGVATIGTAGDVMGVSAGTTDIMYTLPTSCMVMQTVTVNPLPAAIAGFAQVCAGSSITLTDADAGGAWTSGTPSVATIGSSSGILSAISAGTTDINYTLPTGCTIAQTVTVNALPVVSGGSNVAICFGASTGLTGTGGATYSWMPATGLSCTTCANPTASPTVTTTYTVTASTAPTLVYSQSFTSGVAPTTQCTAWASFTASLLGSYSYTGFTIRGSQNTTGITCTDPVVASAVANALRSGIAYTGVSDGQTWHVGTGCSSGTSCVVTTMELSNQGDCSCAIGYSVRPQINNANWGGIDGNTCGAVSQTIEVIFYADGCANSATVTVSVNPLPNAYIVTGGGDYCAGGAGVHIGLDTANLGIRYQLYNGLSPTGSPVNGADAPLDFGLQTAAGTYTVVATDTTTLCSSDMMGSKVVTIIPVVVPTVSISISTNDSICAGTTTIFTASETDGGSDPMYMWKVNGTAVGIDSVAYAYNPADSNVVTVTMVSNHVCAIPDTVSDTIRMRVFPNGTPTVHITANPGDTVCVGTVVTLTAGTTFAGDHPTYTWIKNTAIVSGASSYTYTPNDSDNIYAILISDYMCRLATFAFSDALYMTVEDPIVPAVTITGMPGVYIGTGKPDTLVATVTNGGSNPMYQWYLNGAPIAGATTSMFIQNHFSANDSVSVKVTRTDACGLGTINSVIIHVGVGVNGLSMNGGLTVIPNPNKGFFTIKGSVGTLNNEEVTAEITNMLGQTVYAGKFTTSNGELNAAVTLSNELANGVYMLNVHTSAGNKVFRFVLDK